MDGKFLIPLLISIIAVGVSVFSTWKAWLSPFKPRFNAGAPLLALSPDKEGKNYSLTPIIPVSIVNTGARGGTIKDINVTVTAGDYKWVLEPYFFCSEFGMAGVKEKAREVFHHIYIGGKKEIYKNVLFNPVIKGDQLRPPTFARDKGEIPSGKYVFEFYMSYGASSELRLVQILRFNISEEQAEAISRGTGIIIPLVEEGVSARDELRNSLVK
jgi:hypothetical protein